MIVRLIVVACPVQKLILLQHCTVGCIELACGSHLAPLYVVGNEYCLEVVLSSENRTEQIFILSKCKATKSDRDARGIVNVKSDSSTWIAVVGELDADHFERDCVFAGSIAGDIDDAEISELLREDAISNDDVLQNGIRIPTETPFKTAGKCLLQLTG